MISTIKKLDIYKTLYYYIVFKKYCISVCKKTNMAFNTSNSFLMHEGGRININKCWTENNPFHLHLTFSKNSIIEVRGNFSIYEGGRIGLGPNATLDLGSGYINANCCISCFKSIKIGRNVVIGPNFVIRDSDSHEITGS